MKIGIGCDLSGFSLKRAVAEYLKKRENTELIDFGIESEDKPKVYFEQADKVARALQEGVIERGVLICGTGQGMAIVANKHKGVYAAVAVDIFSAERAKIINNANVLTMGGWITAPFHGIEIVEAWLRMSFIEKMEFKKEFLTNAFNEVKRIEDENFKI
ncbi:MAG: RpiB/LacA/LacB family sugar-phosphate isomerase [Spirochaetales bacterium]|nr:RpiB/LacA/LacB family sugar-phosphate isomerase [Spirochaetales bacterium]